MFNLNRGLLNWFFPDGFVGPQIIIYYLIICLCLLTSYLLGSVNSAILISKTVYGEDIRTKGSGNGGMTNMLRTYGKNAALLTLLGDCTKTILSLAVTGLFLGFGYKAGVSVNEFMYVSGLFAVLGHIFPVYYKFKGGKGVLVTSTMALMLSPVPFALLFIVFAVIVGTSKYVSLGSVTVAILYPVVMHGYFGFVFSLPMPGLLSISTIILACIIVWCHRENLKRISEKKENKLSFGSKKNKNIEKSTENQSENKN